MKQAKNCKKSKRQSKKSHCIRKRRRTMFEKEQSCDHEQERKRPFTPTKGNAQYSINPGPHHTRHIKKSEQKQQCQSKQKNRRDTPLGIAMQNIFKLEAIIFRLHFFLPSHRQNHPLHYSLNR